VSASTPEFRLWCCARCVGPLASLDRGSRKQALKRVLRMEFRGGKEPCAVARASGRHGRDARSHLQHDQFTSRAVVRGNTAGTPSIFFDVKREKVKSSSPRHKDTLNLGRPHFRVTAASFLNGGLLCSPSHLRSQEVM
jgi:hypothetical protein